jgi:hypothetical protein
MDMLKRVLLPNFCTTCIENIVPRFECKLATPLTFVLFLKAPDGHTWRIGALYADFTVYFVHTKRVQDKENTFIF